jgi:hypothetical protein
VITVPWRPGRGYRLELKTELRLARIPFHGVDIRADAEAAAVVRAANHEDELVPMAHVHGQLLSDPALARVRTALATR